MGALGRAGKPRPEVAIRTPSPRMRFRLSVSIPGAGGAFPSRAPPAASAVLIARHPASSCHPGGSRPGQGPPGAQGVKSTPVSLAPSSLSLSACAPVVAAPRLVYDAGFALRHTEKGGGSRSRLPFAPGLGFSQAAAQTRRGRVGLGGTAADAVDITAESAWLPGRCGDPSERGSSLPPPPPTPPGAGVWAGQRLGVGRKVCREIKAHPTPAVKVNVKESGRARPRPWQRARPAPPRALRPARARLGQMDVGD